MSHLLVLGRAGSGKSTLLADWAAELAAAGRGAEVLAILPTAGELRLFSEQVMARSGRRSLVGPRLATLGALAREVLAAAGDGPGPALSPPARAELVAALLVRCEPRLAGLGPSAAQPGLARAVEGLFAELRSAGVSPRDFARAWKSAARSMAAAERRAFAVKCADLELLYAEYEKRLAAEGLDDAEGQMLAAARALGSGRAALPAGARAVIVDGFAEFTAAQGQLVAAALSRAEESRVALCFDGRADGRLAHVAGAYRVIKGARSDWREERLGEPRRFRSADLARLEAGLFDAGESAGRIEHISVTAYPGLRAECQAVARAAARLVREEGFRPEELAVFLRNVEPYAAELERAFGLAGLPLDVARRRPLAASAAAVEFLGWMRAALPSEPDLDEAAALVAALRGPLATRGARAAAADLAALAAERGLWTREELAAGRRRLSTESTEELDGALALVESLRAALPSGSDAPDGWASGAREGLRLLNLAPRIVRSGRPDLAGELAALSGLGAALDGAADSARRAGIARLDLAGFGRVLDAALAGRSLPPRGPRAGSVLVANVFEARTRERRAAFVMGLAEGLFPRPVREGPLLTDRERALLAERGLDLRLAAAADDRERYLFYISTTRAGERLCLSYPSVGTEGRPGGGSIFLDECAAVFAPGALEAATSRQPAGRILPRLGDLAWRGELLGALSAAFNHPRVSSLATEREWRLALALHGRALADGTLSREELARLAPRCSPPGRLKDKAILKLVAEDCSVRSASTLDVFENCPFAHFVGSILGIGARPRLEFDAMLAGQLLHGALRRLFEAWREGGEPPAAKDVEKTLRAEVRERFPWLLGQPRLAPFLAAQAPLLKRALKSEVAALEGSGARPAHLELAFGGGRGAEKADPASSQAPLSLGGALALRGRIDRVDLLPGGKRAVVIDYKRSRAGGRELDRQLGLYALALREVFGLEPVAAGFRILRGEKTVSGHVSAELRSELEAYGFANRLEAENLEEVLREARALAERIAAGEVRAWPLDCENCPDRAAFNPICRFGTAEWRREYAYGESEEAPDGR